MTQATVKTVQFLDPRIEPQPDPVYDYVVGPTQNQYYMIPASGLSNSNITFNNLTTLGIDRAYLDTFELEINAEITFNLARVDTDGTSIIDPASVGEHATSLVPAPDEWTFQSWPFNTCCDEARVNINGGSFFSQPMCYVRAKERYMKQWELSRCYENICPCHKPMLQYELPSDRSFCDIGQIPDLDAVAGSQDLCYKSLAAKYFAPFAYKVVSDSVAIPKTTGPPAVDRGVVVAKTASNDAMTDATLVAASSLVTGVDFYECPAAAYPSRYGAALFNYMQSAQGYDGGFNNSIVELGKWDATNNCWSNYKRVDNKTTVVNVTWREPVFCSPFSSKYDATYGRPLYNITSMDLSFNLQDLGNMIRISNLHHLPKDVFVKSYSINIKTAQLCYQVMTIPPVLTKPLTTLVPYRRFVPYITEFQSTLGSSGGQQSGTQNTFKLEGDVNDLTTTSISSGVYTFNEIPTAIWLFVAPTKARYQTNANDDHVPSLENEKDLALVDTADPGDRMKLLKRYSYNAYGNWDSNKLFAYIRKVEISMANTTQILSTAKPYDLYRIAKANGCQDSYASWGGLNICNPKYHTFNDLDHATPSPMYAGAGSVLRLKPGVDLIVPDQPLIPAANANNMVFKADVSCIIPPHSKSQSQYALWFLFEYVGVAAISPGQCEITMNPLGSGEVMSVSPVMSATSEATEGEIEGSGFWERLKRLLGIANQKAKESGAVPRLLRALNNKYADIAADAADKMGYSGNNNNAPEAKKSRGGACRGGAVIGKGLNDWV